ncbi:MAG: hypothetical protein M0Q43_10880 [Methanothrix sp.]|jgi:hypothetical protein|nr:hypothetical protein [Methanothrix sp.]
MACKSNKMMLNKALVARILSLSLCLLLGISFCQASSTLDALNSYKELQSNFNSDKDKFSEIHPEPAFLPTSERISSSHFGDMPTSRPVNEEIAMTGANCKEQVQDIEAINTVKQRTIVYDDVQRDEGVNESNSMNIEITGNGQEKQRMMDMDDDFGNAIEEKVDSAITSGTNHESRANTGSIRSQVNNLDIDVSGISVKAINTVPGGTAIATSNIKIEPVQIIVEPSEASEKLK